MVSAIKLLNELSRKELNQTQEIKNTFMTQKG
jgi:hypothetical protein